MKKLIVGILVVCLNIINLIADPVSFTWRPNTENNLAGYNLYIAPSVGTVAERHWFTGDVRITVDMPPGYVAWLTAINTAGQESDPTYPLAYNPIVVELVLEGTKELPVWVDVWRWELFRKPDLIFDPAHDDNIPQTLNITKSRVEIETSRGNFQFSTFDSTEGQKFFRSYVAARRL